MPLRLFAILGLFVGLFVALSACAYEGAGIDSPVVRKGVWFDFLDGGDIRRACKPGAPEHYRFVYNGIYQEQVRIYELAPGAGGAPTLDVRVLMPGATALIHLDGRRSPLELNPDKTARIVLRDSDRELLKRAMASAGAFAGPPVGLRLESDSFYWTVAACADGKPYFSAYLWPSEAFDKAAFGPLLFGWDQTGEKVNPPRKAPSYELYGGRSMPPDNVGRFQLRVGPEGLK